MARPTGGKFAQLVTISAALFFGLTGTLLNTITFATNDYTSIVLQALCFAVLGLALTARCWSRASFTLRAVLALVVVGDVFTVIDAGGRRLPSILGW